MPRPNRCPECHSADLTSAGGGRLRCPNCGSEFTYRTAWAKLLLTSALVGVLVTLGMKPLLRRLGLPPDTIWQWLVLGLVVGIVAGVMATRWRTLQKG